MNKHVQHTIDSDKSWEKYDPDTNPIPEDKDFSFIIERDTLLDDDARSTSHLIKVSKSFAPLVNAIHSTNKPDSNILYFKTYN